MSYLAMYEEHMEEEVEEHELLHKWGSVTVKYEGGEWGAVISDTPGDPGGKSYGPFQMSSNAGTVQRFVAQCQYRAFFSRLEVGTEAFDGQWVALSEDKGFLYEQEQFMRKAYFLPIQNYASQQGFDAENRAMQEALFSISVQHGGWKRIIRAAKRRMQEKSHREQIRALYSARRDYVMGLSSLSSLIKHAIMKRYDMEEQDIFSIYDHYAQ